jgi:hypothetical protein
VYVRVTTTGDIGRNVKVRVCSLHATEGFIVTDEWVIPFNMEDCSFVVDTVLHVSGSPRQQAVALRSE